MTQPPAAVVLEGAGIPHRVHWHPAARNHAELVHTGLSVATSAKTLAFSLAGTPNRLVLAAIPGLGRLAYGDLARALGVPRSALRPADPDALAAIGMSPGGVCPITAAPGVQVVLDSALVELPVLYCGSGLAEASIELSGADLARAAANVLVAPISAQSSNGDGSPAP